MTCTKIIFSNKLYTTTPNIEVRFYLFQIERLLLARLRQLALQFGERLLERLLTLLLDGVLALSGRELVGEGGNARLDRTHLLILRPM